MKFIRLAHMYIYLIQVYMYTYLVNEVYTSGSICTFMDKDGAEMLTNRNAFFNNWSIRYIQMRERSL